MQFCIHIVWCYCFSSMPGNQEDFSSCFTNSVCKSLLRSVYVYIHLMYPIQKIIMRMTGKAYW